MHRHIAMFLICLMLCRQATSDDALIAVASNFADVATQLRITFELGSEHTIRLSQGSTGSLYAQILNGAPYDLFLAADQDRPRLLEKAGASPPGKRFVYAVGKLVFWSAKFDSSKMKALEILQRGDFRTLAIANPDLAPYGLAAEQTLQALEQWDRLKSRLVFGQNIGQAHAMVATGNADYGFVALSSVQSERNRLSHEYWEVPQDMYSPIRQEAVLLRHGSDNKAAVAFHEFLQSTAAKEMILAAGFGVE